MLCPRCQQYELKIGKTKKADVEIDYCPQCKGIWLDQGELELISDNTITDLAIPPNATHGQLPCPHCRRVMYQFDYPQTLTTIDMCKKCNGIWLDAGELKEIEIVRSNIPNPEIQNTPRLKTTSATKQKAKIDWGDFIGKSLKFLVVLAVVVAYFCMQYYFAKDYNQNVDAARNDLYIELQQVQGFEDHSDSIIRLIETNHETAKKHATERASSGFRRRWASPKIFISPRYNYEMLELMLAQAQRENNKPALSILVTCQNNREKEFKLKRNWYMNELDP